MLPTDPSAQLALDLVGVFVFALSGGLVAVKKRFDLFGVLVLACAAGLGGGILRDVLIGDIPPVGISDWRLLSAAVAGGLVTFFLHPGFERITRVVRVLDAVGLAAFAVAGSLKAVATPGVAPVTAVIVGVLTAVGGGAIRDLLAGRVPEVLRRELYAVPALLGSLVTGRRRQRPVRAASGLGRMGGGAVGLRGATPGRAPRPQRPHPLRSSTTTPESSHS